MIKFNANNLYFKNRGTIKAICDELDVSVDIGTDILRKRKGWPEQSEELNEWRDIIRKFELSKEFTLADLFA